MIEIRGGKILQRQWRLRPLYTKSILNPNLDQWYEVFPTTGDCMVQFMTMRNHNDETGREGQIRVVCDGQTFLSDSLNFKKYWRYLYLNPVDETLETEGGTGGASDDPIVNLAAFKYPWVAQSMKISARRTEYWPSENSLEFRTRYWSL